MTEDVGRRRRGPCVAGEEAAPELLAELVLGVARREHRRPCREAQSEVPLVRVEGPEMLVASLRVDPPAEVGPR